ncbi:MAG TPA: MDR family MFS transporter [Ktedonobacteraceae bacterium]|nr:MDR family MFS transporter [Ktedonobacteraceae bacterium]
MKNLSRETNSGTLVLESPQAVPQRDTETPRYSRRDVLLTMAGVLMVMLLASLDQTIVSTAMPHVIADLQGFDRYTWVTTAYLLTSTVMVPIYGKLSDLLGRKSVFLFGVIIFLLGSAASGASQSMNQLIVFRAFQGIGAAALMPIAMAIIGDLFTPRERGKWQGVTGAVFGLSSIVGPAAGGWITENASWRWVFYVNLPVGIIALLVLIFLMPTLHRRAQRVSIDYLGAALLVMGTVPLLLGFTWAGSQYAWLSPQIIGLFAFALVTLTVFGIYEGNLARRDKQPIIDPRLFKSSVFSLSVLTTTITSMGMFGSIFFLPLFAQGVLGISATNSGFLLSPMMIALITSSVISGQLVSRTGKYKWIAIVGMLITVGGTLLLYRLDVHSMPLDLTLAMIVLGLGLGFGMALYTIIVQNAWQNKIGEATSALTFFRQIGATVALAAMGSIMSAAYIPAFHDALPASVKHILPAQVLSFFDNPNILLSADAQKQMMTKFASFGPQGMALYQQLLEAVKVGLTQGIHNVFILSTVLMILGLVAVFFLKEIPLRGGKKQASTETSEETVVEVEGVSPTMLH